jgi:hypothetical protein
MDWISVKDRLPEDPVKWTGHYIVYTKYGDVMPAEYRGTNLWEYKGLDISLFVTHWMPLPDPPDDSATYPQTIGSAQESEE